LLAPRHWFAPKKTPRTEAGTTPADAGAMLCRLATAFAITIFVAACSSEKTYDTTFTCTEASGAACSKGQTCPVVPLDAGGCEDLPGLFGHPATKVEVGRPVGCDVGLSYGNPYYGDSQQTCHCQQTSTDAGAKPNWVCGI
jgi:hypothetical protein